MLHEEVINKLEVNQQKRMSGDVGAIPFPYTRLSEFLPGIEQGRYYIVTSAQKGGKTIYSTYTFIFSVVDWYLTNKDKTDIIPKIKFFSLEVSKEAVMLSAMSYKLYHEYNIAISPQKLKSVFKNYILSNEVLDIIRSKPFKDWLKSFEDIVEIIVDIRNPTGIYLYNKKYFDNNGTTEYETVDWKDNAGKNITQKVFKSYKSNNPNEYYIILIDHYSILSLEKGMTLFDTILKMSSDYCLKLRDRYNSTIVAIQQQSATGQTSAYDYKGKLIVDKVKPTPYDLADCKLTARDCDTMFGLFYPYYYDIPEYNGIDLTKIGDNHRELSILLNRHGLSNLEINLFFLGSANHFKELPKKMNDEIYSKIEQIKQLEI